MEGERKPLRIRAGAGQVDHRAACHGLVGTRIGRRLQRRVAGDRDRRRSEAVHESVVNDQLRDVGSRKIGM